MSREELEVNYRSSREYMKALDEFQFKYPKVSEDMMRVFWRSPEYKQGLLEYADRVQKPSF